jgi:hypothetical protein
VVQIAGGALQSTTRASRLTLNADAYVSSCSDAGETLHGMGYLYFDINYHIDEC